MKMGKKTLHSLPLYIKQGLKTVWTANSFKPQRKNARGRHRTDELCSHDNNEVQSLCSDSSSDTHGDCCVDRE